MSLYVKLLAYWTWGLNVSVRQITGLLDMRPKCLCTSNYRLIWTWGLNVSVRQITGLLDMRPKCLCTSNLKMQQYSQPSPGEYRISQNHHARPRNSVYYLRWCSCKNWRKCEKKCLGNAVTFWYALTSSNHATKHRNLFK